MFYDRPERECEVRGERTQDKPKMGSNIKPLRHDDYWYNSVVINGRTYLLNRVGKVGDCIRF